MATNIKYSNEHAESFIATTRPTNIFSLMDRVVVEELFKGYSISLHIAVGLVYTEEPPVSIDSLRHCEALEQLRRNSANLFCRYYRKDLENNKACLQCDKQIALKYYNREWNPPMLYRCHLELWEMAYPVYVDSILVGVLIGGQGLVKGDVTWREELANNENVAWDPFDSKGEVPECSNQVKDIERAVRRKVPARPRIGEERPVIDPQHDLIEMLFGQYKIDVPFEGLITHYNDFVKFGKMVEELLKNLYEAKKEEARRIHIHESSKILAKAGDRLSEEPNRFWNALDEVVQSTLPDVKGYVFYRIDKYGEGFDPVRTCIYDKQLISRDADFRNFCKNVFKEAINDTGQGENLALYDLTSKNISDKFRDLFQRAIWGQKQISGGASAVAIPLVEAGGKITGGLVCVCAREKEIKAGESSVAKSSLRFYAETLGDITDALSMVLVRHAAEEAQAAAWVVRSHELIAPIHAVKGYQDNLKYIFRRYIEPLLSGSDREIKAIFETRLARLESLCDLQELIATSVSLEEEKKPEDFSHINFGKEILLPIVQPLRDFAINEKEVSVYFRKEVSEIPKLHILVGEMKRCLFNLIFNAIKYSDDYSTVHINLEVTDQDYEIHISNKGIGVPKGEEERIFLKFQQGSNSGKKAAYGAGLGLPVARRIARLHGGDVKLISREPEKTVFGLILPRFLQYEPPSGLLKEL